MRNLHGLQDARGKRGIYSRGNARTASGSKPKFNLQDAAKNRLKQANQQRVNHARRSTRL